MTGVLGLYDIIAEIESEDSTELERVISGNIRKVPQVLSTMTLITV